MQIIKQGNRKKQDFKVKFECKNCDCEFIADSKEVTRRVTTMDGIYFSCLCPNCKLSTCSDEVIKDMELTTI